MCAQIFTLCANSFINIFFIKPYQAAYAEVEERNIHIYPIKSTITYVTALHEIGHVLCDSARNTSSELTSEALAWRWAEENTILWNLTAKKHRDLCLKLYLKAEKNPDINSVFWEIYKS